jgi:hypothetical protein
VIISGGFFVCMDGWGRKGSFVHMVLKVSKAGIRNGKGEGGEIAAFTG